MQGRKDGHAARRCAVIALALLGVLLPAEDSARGVPATVQARVERWVMPGGQSIGVAVLTSGLMFVGASDLGGTPSPARKAGLRSGDIIEAVDGQAFDTLEDFSRLIAGGETVSLAINRAGQVHFVSLQPTLDARDGAYRIGAWVRESAAGIGTLTYYEPDTGRFGALGHAIADPDTDVVLPVRTGRVYQSRIISVEKGARGTPGELVGEFFSENEALGTIAENTGVGIVGQLTKTPHQPLYPDGLPTAVAAQVHTGPATLLTTLSDGGVQEYAVEIEKVTSGSGADVRSMVIHVTDPALIDTTGGIVQGMSGSPLIQDGRLIGAVTHVFVSDPTRGYGIFIETMLAQADADETKAA